MRGRIRLVDTQLVLPGNAAMALQDVDLEVESIIDRRSSFISAYLHGVPSLGEQVAGAPAGTYKLPPAHVRLVLRHRRSAQAAANGLWPQGFAWTGYIDRSCEVVVGGDFAASRVPNGGNVPISMPRIDFFGGTAAGGGTAQGYYKGPDIAASGELAVSGPAMAVSVSGENHFDCILPAHPVGGADFGYADGQRLRIVKQYANGSLGFPAGAAAAMVVRENRVLAQAHDWIEFRYNRELARWEETAFGAYA